MKAIEIQELAALLDEHEAPIQLVIECATLIESRNADKFHSPSFVERASRKWRMQDKFDAHTTLANPIPDSELPTFLRKQST